jgi:hypothetical protein
MYLLVDMMLLKLLLLSLVGIIPALVISRQDQLPILTLPYGQWRASTYDTSTDIYTFRNVRYGAPPTGNLR